MATLKYKVIKEGMIDDKIIPINIVFVDYCILIFSLFLAVL